MKNRVVCYLAALLLFFVPATSQAGFVTKKHTTVQATGALSTANATGSATLKRANFSEISSSMQQLASPSSLFVRMIYNGTLGLLALLFGIIGFFAPVFSIFAVVFGFLGIGRNRRNSGLAIAGLVLGIAAILITIFSGFAPLPIF